jgi:hypothetical protein
MQCETLILYVHLLLSKQTKYCTTNFCRYEQDHFLVHNEFLFIVHQLVDDSVPHIIIQNIEIRIVYEMHEILFTPFVHKLLFVVLLN